MTKEKNKTELPTVMEGELQARLIKLREDAGFDVSQMADALCLSEDVIVNLENEAFDLLPEPPYVRGYLRNYAKLSNDDDATELITRYESLRGADASELNFQIKSNHKISGATKKSMSPIWGQLILLGLLVGAIALISSIPAVNSWVSEKWQSFSSQLEPTDASNNPSLLGNLPVPAPLPEDEVITKPESGTTESATDTQSSAPSATTEDSQNVETTTATETTSNTDSDTTKTEATDTAKIETSNEASNTETETTTEKAIASDTQEIAATSLDGSINIKLVFNKEVWLRIKDKENKTVFEGLNKAETEKTIDLKKPLTFRVGNAQGLSLFIDNKAVDISTYINGSIANFTLE